MEEEQVENVLGNGQQYEIEKLEEEKKRIQDEFNSQRAKMKELFLQKEAELQRSQEENSTLKEQINQLKRELDDVKSQLVVDSMTLESNFEVEKRKAAEEIATLQQLINESAEESSSTRTLYNSELVKLQNYIQQLQNEISALKNQKQSPHHSSQEHSSLAPSLMLNALTKGIVKKLGADSFTSQDEQKVQEDTDELRSLVEPLEDQIKALKEKLRSTDEQLQKCRECRHLEDQEKNSSEIPQQSRMQTSASTNTSFDAVGKQSSCDMCSNYEAQLVKEQKRNADLEAKVAQAEKSAERHKEGLLKEIGFRQEMEERWNEKKEEHKQQVQELTRTTECTEQDLKELRQLFNQTCMEMRENLSKLTQERERIYQELDKLQKENENLMGKYTIHSEILQSEAINLPDTVEELHELILKNHQELIREKIGKEAAEAKMNTLQNDILLLRDQITNDRHEWQSLEDSLAQENNSLKKRIHILDKENKQYVLNQEKMLNSDKDNQLKIAELQEQMNELTAAKKTVEGQNNELRTRVYSLQQELDTTETVQKDFVRLSQSLQVQLEKIRASDSEVRWQHEEDVEECPACKSGFSGSKRKTHCRHCGQIFCGTCLTRSVPSGPRQRPSKVCDVCHTLLVKSSAPYFSEAPPMT